MVPIEDPTKGFEMEHVGSSSATTVEEPQSRLMRKILRDASTRLFSDAHDLDLVASTAALSVESSERKGQTWLQRFEEDLERVESRLKSINPFAPIQRCTRSQVSVDSVLNIGSGVPVTRVRFEEVRQNLSSLFRSFRFPFILL